MVTPNFFCTNSIRTVFPKQNNKVSKILWSDFVQFKKILWRKPFRVEDRTSSYGRHCLLFEHPVNLELFGHVLYDTDDHTYVQSQPILLENAFKHCIRQQYTTKMSTMTPHFYCNFRPYMTCWIFVPSFIISFHFIISFILLFMADSFSGESP